MEITIAYCDLHPLYQLRSMSIKTVSPVGDENMIHSAACTRNGCERYFTRDFGYFTSALRKPLDLGDMGMKYRCGWNHEVEFIVLTKIEGVLTWVCPAEKCNAIRPFGTIGPYKLHAIGRAGSGPNIENWKDIYQYQVRGLPLAEEAWIATLESKWQVLRCSNGAQGNWTGEYESPEAALSALHTELEREAERSKVVAEQGGLF